MPSAHILFVTDPLCSWCWGTLPEIDKLREKLAPDVHFELLMAGLQIGSRQLTDTDKQRLLNIWEDVVNTTGQPISGDLPSDPDFIYHSEIPCRAVKVFQLRHPESAWAFFTRLQQAFYLQACNLTSVQQLKRLAEEFGVRGSALEEEIQRPDLIAATREDFALAKQMGAHALPSLHMDTGEGMRLIAGGYTTADFVMEVIKARLQD